MQEVKIGNTSRRKATDGRWVTKVYNMPMPDGTVKKTSYFYGPNKKECIENAKKAIANVANPCPALPGLPAAGAKPAKTFGKYMDDWMQARFDYRLKEEAMKPLAECRGIRRNTLRSYSSALKNHVLPHEIAKVLLPELTRKAINAHYRLLLDAGKGSRVVALTHNIIRKALRDAVLNDILPSNPAIDANVFLEEADKQHKVPKKRVHWTAEHRASFFEAAAKDRLEALYIVSFFSGLREGELFGLLWRKIVIESETVGYLIVDEQLEEAPLPKDRAPNADNSLRLTGPKSFSGIRKVAIGPKVIAALRAHRARMEAEALAQRREVTDDSLVFCTPKGGPLRKSNFRTRCWLPLLDKAGVPRPVFHGLRGMHASLLNAAKVKDVDIAARLGHSDPRTTVGWYITSDDTLDRAAAEAFEAIA